MRNKILKFKKISLKLTLVYAFAFSLILLVLNASVLYGVKYFLVSESFKQVEGTSKGMLSKVMQLEKTNVNLHDENLLQDINPKENIYVKILDNNGNTINVSPRWNIDISN